MHTYLHLKIGIQPQTIEQKMMKKKYHSNSSQP